MANKNQPNSGTASALEKMNQRIRVLEEFREGYGKRLVKLSREIRHEQKGLLALSVMVLLSLALHLLP